MEGIWLVAFVLQWVILLLLAVLMVGVLRYKDSLERLLNAYPGLLSNQVITLIDEQGTVVRQFGVDIVPTGFTIDREGLMVSQTSNPHLTNWLYTATKIALPKEPIVTGPVGRRVPTAYLKNG